MIGKENKERCPPIPGRLKAVVIDPKLSVAYAGNSEPAMDAIRSVRTQRLKGCSTADILPTLEAATIDGKTDFVVASHDESPQLLKISNGRSSMDLEEVAIGDTSLVKSVLRREVSAKAFRRVFHSPEEQKFKKAFSELFNDSGVHLNDEVGGLPIILEASPFGHTYSRTSRVAAWDIITLGIPVSAQQIADRKSGMTEWRFQITDSELRGIGIVGIGLPAIGIGWVHSPLETDDPLRIALPHNTDDDGAELSKLLAQEIEARAEALGGGILVDNQTRAVSAITIDQLKEIYSIAENSPYPTKICLHKEGFWLICGDHPFKTEGLIQYVAMGDPVKVVRDTIADDGEWISGMLKAAKPND
jgi:hypothetical protein